jgi:hypothetical protein
MGDVRVHAPMFPVVSAASLVMAAAAVGATRTLDIWKALPTSSIEINTVTSVPSWQNQNKMCLDSSSLVRSMSLLDSKLQEQVGSMDIVNPLCAMFAEHCHAPDSDNVYTPSSYPGHSGLSCTPKGEFLFVVREDAIDKRVEAQGRRASDVRIWLNGGG